MSHEHDALMHEGKEPPPPGTGAMAGFRWLLLLAALLLALWASWSMLRPASGQAQRFTCPMVEHAFVVADEAGDCPLCHMKLMPLDPAMIEARRKEAEADMAAAGPGVPGLMPVSVHLDRAQRMGVRSAQVEAAEIDEELRAPAFVSAPEQGESRVHARAPGFIEKIVVSELGAPVAAGQPVAYLYAPEIYRAQEEFLLARRWLDAGFGAGGAGQAGAAGSAPAPLAESARRRLELLGMSGREIDEIARKKEPSRLTPVRAMASGVVSRKEVALGAYVTPEMPLYEIVDLARAYLVADLPASQVTALQRGARGVASFDGHEAPVKVDLVYPEVNAAARSTRVRLRFEGPKPPLRPGLYGEVRFSLGRRKALLVPRDAVVDTGSQRYLFVDLGDGKFAPRLVSVGVEHQGRLEIRNGVSASERVVSGAAFLIDSESRLQAAFSGLLAPPSSASPPASSPPASSPSPRPPPNAAPRPSPSSSSSSSSSPSPSSSSSSSSSSSPSSSSSSSSSPSSPSLSSYVCPMHPHETSATPGRCGVCGMDLELKR